MKRKLVTFVLTGLLAFSTTGMVFAETTPLENPITPDQPIVSEEPQSVITIGAAIAIALETVPNGSVVSIKLDKQHPVKVYKIQVKSGTLMTMVKINAITGDVLKTELEKEPATDPVIDPSTDPITDPTTDPTTDPVTNPTTQDPAAPLPTISFENAVQIALASVTDGTFVSIRLGAEHDVMVYKVIIQTGKKANPIKIDATSGDILKPTNDKNDKKPIIEKPAKKTVDDSASQTNLPKIKGKK
ncbi:MAG: PepSY domain-containing protein [Acetobacterium woodii]|nr:PepSY domain-containing protein [Acetobacterium woodii]